MDWKGCVCVLPPQRSKKRWSEGVSHYPVGLMYIPQKKLEAFKTLWQQHYETQLSDEEAHKHALQLLSLIQVTYHPPCLSSDPSDPHLPEHSLPLKQS